MTKKLTKEEALFYIRTWRSSNKRKRKDGFWHEPADDLHNYFEATNLRNWIDVGREATKAYNIMFKDYYGKAPDGSPVSGIWMGASAQAAHGVWRSVADAFGLNVDVLEATLEDWYMLYGDDAPPPPMTMRKFNKRYKDMYKFFIEEGLL
jgi:hypothetical protein